MAKPTSCRKLSLSALVVLAALCLSRTTDAGEKMHGVSIFGPESLKYAEDEAFAYLDPDAPKGGTFRTDGGYFT